jgi:hypothetical protein
VRDLHITVVVIRKVNSPIPRADSYLNSVVAIIRRLRVILEYNNLPWSRGELSSSNMREERLGG